MTTSRKLARKLGLGAWIAGVLTVAGWGLSAASQEGTATVHPGKIVYDTYCAGCHANPAATRSPALDVLKAMRRQALDFALTEGKMKVQGQALSPEERAAVVDYLAAPEASDAAWIAGMMCPVGERAVDLTAPATVTGFGFDKAGHRRLTKAQAGLATADFRNLELAWAIGFPGATSMRSQPVVVGSTIFLPVAETNRVFAISVAERPCVKWVYNGGVQLRTSAAYGDLGGRKVIAFGDARATVHLIDAATGQLIWKKPVGISPLSITTGAPIFHKDRVIVPISQFEIVAGANPGYLCCKVHGAVRALAAADGATLWTAHTMEDAKPIRDRGDGKMLWGPSGAPIWASPTLDEKRGLIYVGTGEANSEPAHRNTDAILAIDVNDGSIRWSFQATPDDVFLTGCMGGRGAAPGLNCPKNAKPRDVDFGAQVVIARGKDGADLVVAGQKSGTVWALDPDKGALVWRQNFGDGSPLGGIHWGLAYNGERIFVPINHPYANFGGPPPGAQKPGISAVNAKDGAVAWTYAVKPDCSGERKANTNNACAWNIGFSGAPAVIDGAVASGSNDGFIRAFDTTSGDLLFQFDTARPFETVNGVKAKGGAIDNATVVAANGYLLVGSGYAMFGQPPGNVLLAFRPRK